MGALFTQLTLSGDGFLACYRDGDGEMFQLGVLESNRVTIESRSGLPTYVVTTLEGAGRP